MSSGMPDTSPIKIFAWTSRTGSSRSPCRNSQMCSRPSRLAFSRAASTARCDRSTPITLAAPSLAATNARTPVPQPTSITVSPGSISIASASDRLVVVGLNTPGPSSNGKGPVRPFHWISVYRVDMRSPGGRPGGPGGGRLRLHGQRPERRVRPWNDLPCLYPTSVGLQPRRERFGVDAQRARRIPLDPRRRSPEEGGGAVRVAAEQVDIAGAELREPLEQLLVPRALGLLPRRLPRLVGAEEVAVAEELPSRPVVLLCGHRVEVREV